MKITNGEIAEFKSDLATSDAMLPGRFWQRIYPALDRLAKLEAAVAFKGFDEVPEAGSGVEVIDIEGVIYLFGFDGDKYESDFGEPKKACEMKETGHVGWRYPVGDLS